MNAKDGEVRDQIGEILPLLSVTAAKLEIALTNLQDLAGSVEGITAKLTELQIWLAEANFSRVNFESWVIAQLGSTGPAGIVLPEGWDGTTSEIGKIITGSPNPLVAWANNLLRRQ